MEIAEFQAKIEETLEQIKEKLIIKGIEYVRNDDSFHNFNQGAKVSGKTKFDVLDGFMLKHYVSYRDMLKDIREGNYPDYNTINEKLGDIILYFILQKAMMEHEACQY